VNTEPYGTTLFCDDIRHEVNGKMTLVGCYSSELNFNGPQPGVLPTFAALVNIRIPVSAEFNSIKLSVLKEEGDETTEIFGADIEVTKKEKSKALQDLSTESTEEKILSMTVPLQWSPLPVKESGFIKVRAYLDGGKEIRLGALTVKFPKEAPDQAGS